MEKVLIVTNKTVLATTKTIADIASLGVGSLAIFADNGKIMEDAIKDGDKINYVQLAVGRASGLLPKFSVPIYPKAFKIAYQPYKAPVAMVALLGNDNVSDKSSGAFAAGDIGTEFVCTNVGSSTRDFREGTTALLQDEYGNVVLADTPLVLGTKYTVIAAGTPDAWGSTVLASTAKSNTLVVSTPVVGLSYGFTVVDLTKEINERRKFDISLPVLDENITNAQMLANLVARANADSNVSAICTSEIISNVGIKFTGADVNQRFTILPTGILLGSDVAVSGEGISQRGVPGINTYEQVLEAERQASFGEGRTGLRDVEPSLWKVASVVAEDQRYYCYTIKMEHLRGGGYTQQNSHNATSEISIYIPEAIISPTQSGSSDLSDLIAKLAGLSEYVETDYTTIFPA